MHAPANKKISESHWSRRRIDVVFYWMM